MTGFAGRIFYEGDAEEAQSLLGDAIKLADTLRAWKTTQKISAVTKVFNLRDGAYCVIADLQDMRAMQIVIPTASTQRLVVTENEWEVYEDVGVMDVMSGIVTGARIIKEVITTTDANGNSVTAESDAVMAFTPTTLTSGRYSSVNARRRLAVEEDSSLYRPVNTPPELVFSIHEHVKPSCFSGSMRKLAQLVMGIGRPIRPMWEQTWMQQQKRPPLPVEQTDPESNLPEEVRSPFGLYFATPTLTGRDPYETPFLFDYRFAKTHGISFDQDNKPWIVEISTRGVHAMPMYLDPVSLTQEGRARYLAVSPELQEIFTLFGGMPLGISFPAGQEFAKWKKAGEVVELISAGDMGAFYSKGAFSSAIGWSFNSRGSEAHNCCVGNEGPILTGNHYRVRFQLQRETFPALTEAHTALVGYVQPTQLYENNKIRRLTAAQAAGLVRTFEQDATAGRAAFDDLTVTPTLAGTAQLTLLRTGYLYSPAAPIGQPQIKFPEPLAGGLLSFDFRPTSPTTGVLRCDAPMFVCHINDEVEVVNFFADYRPRFTPGGELTRQRCQFTGSWEQRTFAGEPFIAGNFYSSRWDWRKEITPNESVTAENGRRIGTFGSAGALGFFSSCISVTAFAVFTIRLETETKQGIGRRISVAIPFHTRDCYYMAQHSYVTASTRTRGLRNEYIQTNYTALWKLYNNIFHWVGCGSAGDNINAGTIRCIAKQFGRRDIEACAQGSPPGAFYYSVCPEVRTPEQPTIIVNAPLWNNAILGDATWPNPFPAPTPYVEIVETNVGTHEFEIRMISDSGFGEIITERGSVSGKDPATNLPVDFFSLTMSNWWWMFSPADGGAMPWIGVTHSCLGNPVLNYHTDLDASLTKSVGSPTNMHTSTTSCYVGVIR